MAKRILVPLDQSSAAESILPLVSAIARGDGALVRLLPAAPMPQSRLSKEGRTVAYADWEMERLIPSST